MAITNLLTEPVKRAFDIASKLEQQILTLQVVSGHTVEELTRLFAAGYTLSPPDPPRSLSEIFKEE